MTYAQWSTGFRGGGVNPRPFIVQQETTFKPETEQASELGLKSDFFDHHVRVNAAAFYNQYNDIVFVNTDQQLGLVAGRTLMNGRITWKSSSQDWETVVGATNLTNKFYYINKVFGAAPTNITEGQPGAPREWFVTLKRNF
jgi:outer membrane receptor protein involved in Fe transport